MDVGRHKQQGQAGAPPATTQLDRERGQSREFRSTVVRYSTDRKPQMKEGGDAGKHLAVDAVAKGSTDFGESSRDPARMMVWPAGRKTVRASSWDSPATAQSDHGYSRAAGGNPGNSARLWGAAMSTAGARRAAARAFSSTAVAAVLAPGQRNDLSSGACHSPA